MKSLQILFLAIVLACSTPSFGNSIDHIPTPNPKANTEISHFIFQQLSSKDLGGILEENEDVKISFQITNDNEIVVMKTNASNKNLDQYIKSKLNYEALKISGLRYNTSYMITVEFEKK